jgi:hypothetical protein
MKHNLSKILLIVFCTLAIFSCSKDEDEAKPNNNITYDGKSYVIATGVFDLDATVDNFNSANGYYQDIILVDNNFTVSNGGFSGTGNAVSISLISATAEIEAGTYNFQSVEAQYKPGDFTAGAVFVNFSMSSGTGGRYQFTDGKVVVTKSGDTYTVTIDGTADGKEVKASFTGKVTTI